MCDPFTTTPCVSGLVVVTASPFQPLSPGSGTLFVEPRSVVMSLEAWRITVDLETVRYGEALTKVSSALRDIKDTIQSAHPRIGLARVAPEELSLMEQGVRKLVGRIDQINSLLPKERRRRGLVNAGGSVLKMLFGTPDSHDWLEVQEFKMEASNKLDLLRHSANQQISAINELGRRNSDMTAKLNRTIDLVTRLMTCENGALNKTIDKLNGLVNDLEFWDGVNTNLRILNLDIELIRDDIRDLEEIIEYVSLGKLSTLLLAPDELLHIFREVTHLLPPGVSWLIPPTSESVYTMYKYCETRAVAQKDRLSFIIKAPLKREQFTMTHYSIVQVPVVPKDYSVAMKIRKLPDGLSVTGDHQYYTEWTTADWRQCIPGSPTLCSAPKRLRPLYPHSCATALFLNSSRAGELCEWTIWDGELAEMWTPFTTSHTWVYHLPQNSRLTEQCRENQNPTTQVYTLQGVGLYHHRDGCTLHTKDGILLPRSVTTSRHTVELGVGYVLPSRQHQLPQLHWSGENIIEAVNELAKLRPAGDDNWVPLSQVPEWIQGQRLKKAAWISIPSVFVTLVLVYVVYRWHRRYSCKCNRSPDDTPIETGPYTETPLGEV